MAIGGSGTPSCRVVVRSGLLVATGIVTNKPPELIFSDTERNAYGTLAQACDRLAMRQPIQVDMTGGQFLQLVALWKQRTADLPLPAWAGDEGNHETG